MEQNREMARRLARQVAAAGGQCFYVGGCVRDRLLNRQSKDLDLEVHGISPQTLMTILDGLGERVSVGKSFGIFGLKHYDLDISLAEGDPQTAAGRRDLTINAMMQDVLTEEVLDFFGGAEDLQRGILRHVDETAFREDPLRVFRVAQFAARFGFSVDWQTCALCGTMDLSGIARERVFGELEKALLQSARPSVFFAVLRQMGCLQPWFAEAEALIGVPQDPVHHPEGDVWNHTMAVLDRAAQLRDQTEQPLAFLLSALCHDFGKVHATQTEGDRIRALGHEEAGLPLAEAFLSRLTEEKKLTAYVQNMVLLHMRPNLLAAQKAKAKSLCSLFDRSCCPGDLLLLAKADHFGKDGAYPYDETERFLRDGLELFRDRMAQPHVQGRDLVQAGHVPGPAFAEALAYAHKLRLAGISKESALQQTLGFLRSRK